MHTHLSEDSNRHSPQRWEGGVSIRRNLGIKQTKSHAPSPCTQIMQSPGASVHDLEVAIVEKMGAVNETDTGWPVS